MYNIRIDNGRVAVDPTWKRIACAWVLHHMELVLIPDLNMSLYQNCQDIITMAGLVCSRWKTEAGIEGSCIESGSYRSQVWGLEA